jgi:tetratricopeptide (TPR) repeat protein
MSLLMEKVAVKQSTRATETSLNEPLLVASVLTITAMVFAAAIRFQFVYDDQGQIVENALVQSWRFVPQYFRGQVWQHLFPNAAGDYYRPLNVLWFRVNDALFGLNPAGWHVLAILLHVLATALAYLIARKLTGRPLVAGLTALLFGVHPMRHEVVAWVSGTTESLCAVLFFLAFLAYLKSREGGRARWMAISCVFYGASLLAKETAIVLPAVVFAHAWCYGQQADGNVQPVWFTRVSRSVRMALAYAPVAVVYLVVRVSVLHGFSHARERVSAWTVALTLPSVLFFYVRQWLLPIRLSEFYDLEFLRRADLAHLWLPLLGLFVLAGVLWFFREKLGRREAGMASAWMILTLLPALDLFVFPSGELVHDRYFYLPGFGAALLVALAAGLLARGPATIGVPRLLLLVTLAILAPLCYSAATASSYWVDDFIMFQHANWVAPENGTARNNYAIELDRQGKSDAAIPILKGLLKEQPNNYLANFNLGRISYETGDMATAEQYFEHAEMIDPNQADTYLQLSLINLRRNQSVEAESNIRRAIALRPVEPIYHYALGVTLAQGGNCPAAMPELIESLELKPGFVQAQMQMQQCRAKETKRLQNAAPDSKPGTAGVH